MRLSEIATRLKGDLEGRADTSVTGVASLETAKPDQISYIADQRQAARGAASGAGCVLVTRCFANTTDRTVIRVTDPRLAFSRVVTWLQPRRQPPPGVDPTAVVDPSARIGAGTSIGAYCVVGAGSVIGRDCVLHPNVTVYDEVGIGDRVVIHAGTIIGADGFGFVPAGDHYEKVPQVGIVEIGDDVEIGANCTIDRGTLDATRIGKGTKIDNLVHIAHNSRIGCHVAIAGQSGTAGGAVIGDWSIIAGQSGIGERAQLEPRSIIGAKSMIAPAKRIAAGTPMFGIPARPLRVQLKQLANLGHIDDLRRIVKELQRRLDADDDTPE